MNAKLSDSSDIVKIFDQFCYFFDKKYHSEYIVLRKDNFRWLISDFLDGIFGFRIIDEFIDPDIANHIIVVFFLNIKEFTFPLFRGILPYLDQIV